MQDLKISDISEENKTPLNNTDSMRYSHECNIPLQNNIKRQRKIIYNKNIKTPTAQNLNVSCHIDSNAISSATKINTNTQSHSPHTIPNTYQSSINAPQQRIKKDQDSHHNSIFSNKHDSILQHTLYSHNSHTPLQPTSCITSPNCAKTSQTTHIKIQIENRIFSLNLENFNTPCRNKIFATFEQKKYSLEELLSMFITNLRNQNIAEMELLHILKSL